MSSEVCGKCTVHTLNSTLVTGQTEFPPTHTLRLRAAALQSYESCFIRLFVCIISAGSLQQATHQSHINTRNY